MHLHRRLGRRAVVNCRLFVGLDAAHLAQRPRALLGYDCSDTSLPVHVIHEVANASGIHIDRPRALQVDGRLHLRHRAQVSRIRLLEQRLLTRASLIQIHHQFAALIVEETARRQRDSAARIIPQIVLIVLELKQAVAILSVAV